MNKTRPARARKRHLRPRRAATPTRSTLVKLLRPIVRTLMAEELSRLQDRGDVRASREALAEGGAVPHKEFWKYLFTALGPTAEPDVGDGRIVGAWRGSVKSSAGFGPAGQEA